METDRRFRETARQLKETDKQLKQTDLQLKETDLQLKETDRKIGRLGNRPGEFVEEMVRPSVVKLFRERGIDVHVVYSNARAYRDDDAIEIDFLVHNDNDMVAVECKSSLSVNDIDEHLERVAKIKKLFPRYKDMNIMGAVAAMVLPDDVARYAYKKQLFVLAQSGNNMIIRNDKKFRPFIW